MSYLPFIQASGGGITVSGGEPLLQIPFLIELFKECKKQGIHTTIDSSEVVSLTLSSLLNNLKNFYCIQILFYLI